VLPVPYQADVVREMKARRHERNTLDALHEIVLYLRDMREERKAIVTCPRAGCCSGQTLT
jgi:hypothetical protein